MSYSRRLRTIGCFLLTSLSISLSSMAQSTSGSIYGTIEDPTGAPLPRVVVSVKDIHTGTVQTVETNESGEYTFPTLKPSDYDISTTASGFKSRTQSGVQLSANQNVHVTFQLELGETTENVTVVAGITLVDTREAQLGETIEQERLQDLPTLNRSTYDLVQTTPGVSSYTPDLQIGSRDGAKFSVNGLPSDMVSNYIDGAYNNSYKQGGGNKVPNPDALQEFRLLTSNFDAEFGRSPGAVANVITRSGTAQLHGSAYEYLRNEKLNAQNYFTASGTKRLPYKQNQFGGTFGGPLPLLHSAFFFLSYEQLVLHQAGVVNQGSIIAPTDLERQGNFSQSATKPVLPTAVNCGTTAAPVLCVSALDPVAQNILAFVPHNTAAGVAHSSPLPAMTVHTRVSADSITTACRITHWS